MLSLILVQSVAVATSFQNSMFLVVYSCLTSLVVLPLLYCTLVT